MKKAGAKRSEFGSVPLAVLKGQAGGKEKETRNETNGALWLTLNKPWGSHGRGGQCQKGILGAVQELHWLNIVIHCLTYMLLLMFLLTLLSQSSSRWKWQWRGEANTGHFPFPVMSGTHRFPSFPYTKWRNGLRKENAGTAQFWCR